MFADGWVLWARGNILRLRGLSGQSPSRRDGGWNVIVLPSKTRFCSPRPGRRDIECLAGLFEKSATEACEQAAFDGSQ
jgi:hypothetical protein